MNDRDRRLAQRAAQRRARITGQPQPVSPSPPSGKSGGGATLRDEVWERKRAQFEERRRHQLASRGSSSASGGGKVAHPELGTDRELSHHHHTGGRGRGPPAHTEAVAEPPSGEHMSGYDRGYGGYERGPHGSGDRATTPPHVRKSMADRGYASPESGYPGEAGPMVGSHDVLRQPAEPSRPSTTKSSYLLELEEQMRIKEARKARERAEQRDDGGRYDYFGRPGGGAPMRNADGSVVTNIREFAREQGRDLVTPGSSPSPKAPARHGRRSSRDFTDDGRSGGRRSSRGSDGYGGHSSHGGHGRSRSVPPASRNGGRPEYAASVATAASTKSAYLLDLEAQIEEKKMRKAREKAEQEAWEKRVESDAGRYDYWGKPSKGGGTPNTEGAARSPVSDPRDRAPRRDSTPRRLDPLPGEQRRHAVDSPPGRVDDDRHSPSRVPSTVYPEAASGTVEWLKDENSKLRERLRSTEDKLAAAIEVLEMYRTRHGAL